MGIGGYGDPEWFGNGCATLIREKTGKWNVMAAKTNTHEAQAQPEATSVLVERLDGAVFAR